MLLAVRHPVSVHASLPATPEASHLHLSDDTLVQIVIQDQNSLAQSVLISMHFPGMPSPGCISASDVPDYALQALPLSHHTLPQPVQCCTCLFLHQYPIYGFPVCFYLSLPQSDPDIYEYNA